MDRIEFYLDNRDDRVNFEAIILKHSQMTEMIMAIEGYPRNNSYPITPSSCAPFQNGSRKHGVQHITLEEVQKYPAVFNKFCKDYNSKFTRMNIWKAIGEKFGLDAAEPEKKVFHLVLDVMLSRLQQSLAIWIDWQTTSTNDHPLLVTCRVVMKAKVMQIMVKKQKAQTMSRTCLNMRKDQVRTRVSCNLECLFLQLL